MTTTLLALYRRPDGGEDELAAFEQAYAERHLPLVARTPGLQALRVSRVKRVLSGTTDVALIARMPFADWDALKAGLNSEPMAEAGRVLDEIGGSSLATMLVVEEATDLIPETAP